MNPIQSCLQMATERKAQEILFNSAQPVRLRVGKDLQLLTTNEISANELRAMLSQILDEDERKSLFEDFRVQGSKTLGSVAFKFDFQIDFEGVNGSIYLKNSQQANWNFPAIVLESVARNHGLNIITGPRRSGKSTAVANIIQALQGRNKVIASYGDDESAQFPIAQLLDKGAPQSADLIVIDSVRLDCYEKALRLAEEGRSVLLTMPFWNYSMALHRLMDLCEGSEVSKARRLSVILQSVLGLRILVGLENPQQGAFELLLADSEVQNSIANQNFSALPELIKASAEKTGMRSMNHTLFQLLMKRKIELKTAFEASPEPEELDLLLKKVGI
jgi:twitching motility protein PilT